MTTTRVVAGALKGYPRWPNQTLTLPAAFHCQASMVRSVGTLRLGDQPRLWGLCGAMTTVASCCPVGGAFKFYNLTLGPVPARNAAFKLQWAHCRRSP